MRTPIVCGQGTLYHTHCVSELSLSGFNILENGVMGYPKGGLGLKGCEMFVYASIGPYLVVYKIMR